MKRLGTALVLMGTLVLVPTSAHATATKTNDAIKTVKRLHVTEDDRHGPKRLHVRFNDGTGYLFTPCKHQDSRNCFWLASERGNGLGRSFVDLRGTVYYLDGKR